MPLAMNRIAIHLWLNSYHAEWLDCIMKVLTEFGGNIPLVICGCVFLYKMRYGIFLTIPQVIAMMMVQPLKHIFNHPRPLVVFQEAGVALPTVAGVDLHSWNSFPSGHTASVFALMVAIAMLLPKKWMKICCIVFAAIVGYSRIYLSQHFLDDVIAGAVIGIIAAIANPLKMKKETTESAKCTETNN